MRLLIALCCAVKPCMAEVFLPSRNKLDKGERHVSLTLQRAVERGLRKNFGEIDRRHAKEELDLDWRDTHEGFWLPRLSLELKTSPQRLLRLREGAKHSAQAAGDIPEGTLALKLGEYTLFNWGRDYLAYRNRRAEFVRRRSQLDEQRRELKHRLMSAYSELQHLHAWQEIARENLRRASFVYRFNRERVELKKVSRQEYYQARLQYLAAQDEFRQARERAGEGDRRMAQMIADSPGTRYVLAQEIRHRKLKTPLSKMLELAERFSPAILEAKKNLENAKRSHQLAERENLPLPKITLNLGAYTYAFGDGRPRGAYATKAGDSNIDIVASINASWALTGEGGLFNGRKPMRALVKRRRFLNRAGQAKFVTESAIADKYRETLSLEDRIAILNIRATGSDKALDLTLDNYTKGKASFENLREALRERQEAHSELALAGHQHFAGKVTLASLAGVENFPGEIFEKMVREKKK